MSASEESDSFSHSPYDSASGAQASAGEATSGARDSQQPTEALPSPNDPAAPHGQTSHQAALDLERAYAEHGPYVARLALRLLGRPDEAEDLVHDVFLIAAERLDTVRQADSLKHWLASIAINRARNRLRFRRVKKFFSLDAPGSELASGIPGPSRSVESRVLLQRVFRALDRAPAAYRLAWTLRYLEEEDLETCARLCNVSLATVKRHIAGAQVLIEGELS